MTPGHSEIGLADVERLATVLDEAELDEEDRATLHAVFALAGRAAARDGAPDADADADDEVAGFSFSTDPNSLLGSFQLGGSSGGSSGGIQISRQVGAASPQIWQGDWTSETFTTVTLTFKR
jgi:hypothetical protein